jgi:hypothetical protein
MEHIPSNSGVQVKSDQRIVEGYTVRDANSDRRPLIKIPSISGEMTSLSHGKWRVCALYAKGRYATPPVAWGSDLWKWGVNEVQSPVLIQCE